LDNTAVILIQFLIQFVYLFVGLFVLRITQNVVITNYDEMFRVVPIGLA